MAVSCINNGGTTTKSKSAERIATSASRAASWSNTVKSRQEGRTRRLAEEKEERERVWQELEAEEALIEKTEKLRILSYAKGLKLCDQDRFRAVASRRLEASLPIDWEVQKEEINKMRTLEDERVRRLAMKDEVLRQENEARDTVELEKRKAKEKELDRARRVQLDGDKSRRLAAFDAEDEMGILIRDRSIACCEAEQRNRERKMVMRRLEQKEMTEVNNEANRIRKMERETEILEDGKIAAFAAGKRVMADRVKKREKELAERIVRRQQDAIDVQASQVELRNNEQQIAQSGNAHITSLAMVAVDEDREKRIRDGRRELEANWSRQILEKKHRNIKIGGGLKGDSIFASTLEQKGSSSAARELAQFHLRQAQLRKTQERTEKIQIRRDENAVLDQMVRQDGKLEEMLFSKSTVFN